MRTIQEGVPGISVFVAWVAVVASAASQLGVSDAPVVLMFTGDNLLGGRMEEAILRNGEQYSYAKVSKVFREADFLFGNLECPITTYPHATPGKSAESVEQKRDFVFKASPRHAARILKDAGFDVLSPANNHAMDYQAQGLTQTIEKLQRLGIVSVGAGRSLQEASSARIVSRQYGPLRCGKSRAGLPEVQ